MKSSAPTPPLPALYQLEKAHPAAMKTQHKDK